MNPRLAALALLLAVSCGRKSAGPKVYKVTADALVAAPDRYIGPGKEVLVHGWVVPGSISHTIEDQTSRHLFQLEEKGARVTILHLGPAPDALKDREELMVHGTVSKGEGSLVVKTGEGGVMMVMPKF